MQKKTLNKNKPELTDKIVRVAYGDAGIIEKITVTWKAAGDENIKNLLEEYRAAANIVHKLKDAELPDYVIENVNNKIKPERAGENISSKISHSFFAVFSRRAIPFTAAGIIAITFISFLIFNQPAPVHKYTKAEIELAEAQLKQSLAIVGKVFTKAEKNFSQDILNDQLNKTLNRGYYLVNNILTGG